MRFPVSLRIIKSCEPPRDAKTIFGRYVDDKIRIRTHDMSFVSLFMMINDLMRSELIRTKICGAIDANSKNFVSHEKKNMFGIRITNLVYFVMLHANMRISDDYCSFMSRMLFIITRLHGV